MTPIFVSEGRGPIILAQPHSGMDVPENIRANLNEIGRRLLDTDWHIPRLYDGLLPEASIVRANFSRYVIDPNRDPAGGSLYPGQNTTSLVPETTFDGVPIWKTPLTDEDIADRLACFHVPYHDALRAEISRVKAAHGFAILYDCHSIRSTIPHLFDGRLPDLNIGTNDGASCDVAIQNAARDVCDQQDIFNFVVNGRFKGGWTTRHYGQPQAGVHAIQMEIAQCAYLSQEVPPFTYDVKRAETLRRLLGEILGAIGAEGKNIKSGGNP